ncbi:MAG: NADH-quinone oxidoreductase subunit A, partial [Dehalococcoidia bacterium]
RPSKPTPIKLDIYECGMESIGGRWAQFDVKYYKYALLFVVFDVIAIFVYPWAVYLNNRSGLPRPGLFALVEMGIFLLVLAVGWAYAWRKRALEWE